MIENQQPLITQRETSDLGKQPNDGREGEGECDWVKVRAGEKVRRESDGCRPEATQTAPRARDTRIIIMIISSQATRDAMGCSFPGGQWQYGVVSRETTPVNSQVVSPEVVLEWL